MSSRRTSVLALLLYTTFIVYQSLAGGGAWNCAGEVLTSGARLSRSDVIANVVAYVPLGLLLMLATTRSGATGWRVLVVPSLTGGLIIAGLSLGMELVQACQPHRVSSVYDLVANVTGGLLGVAGGLVIRRAAAGMGRGPSRHGATPEGRLRLLTVAVAGAWVVSQTMPWVFAVDLGTIRSNLSFLRHWSDGPPLDPWRVLRHAGAWVALACACRLAAHDRRVAAAGLALTVAVSLLLQVVMDARAPLSFEEVGGMAVAATVALPAMVTGQPPLRRRWATGLLLGAMVTVAAYELRPEPGAPTQAFSWWPRVGLGGLLGAVDYALLFGWFGLAAVVAARWAEGDGHRHARRAWPLAAILMTLGFEVMQTRIAGRGPDVSAPVFTLLAVIASTAVLGDARDPDS